MDGPLPQGSWLGIMGGGQLGRMFCMAAQSLGYRVCVLDPAEDSPAGRIAERHLRAGYEDEAALAQMAGLCSVVSTEFENVPAASLARLARDCRVTPNAHAVSIAQDRIREKRFVEACGARVAPYRAIVDREDLEGVDASLLPGILKVARLGYDGKGQARVATVDEVQAALQEFSWGVDAAASPAGLASPAGSPGHVSLAAGVPCVLEKRLDLAAEISVVVARCESGECAVFPVAQNMHRNGILAVSSVPAAVDEKIAAQARAITVDIAGRLGYVGVLCIEFFALSDGSLIVNEMAPRPHNSGHYSIDAALTSQFEQQARVMARLPLGATDLLAPAVMLNILGDAWFATGQLREPDWAAVLAHPGAKLHLYGKAEARPGRKMGHVTIVARSAVDAHAQAAAIAPLIAQRLD